MRYFTFIFICLFISNTFSQHKVLKDFDFQNKNYCFYFYESYNGQKNKKADELRKPFTISDKNKLENLKNNWVANSEAVEELLCGYDYKIYIVENDSIVGSLSVNTECGHVNASGIGTSFDFTPCNPFENLIKDSDIYSAVFSSDSIPKSRELYSLLRNQKNVYYRSVNYDKWVNYDGQFYYIVEPKEENSELKNRKEIIKDIYDRFNNTNILINYSSISKTSLSGYFYCSNSFYNELKNNIPLWDDFKFKISATGAWEPWSKVYNKKVYSAIIFTNNEDKLNELIIKAKNIGAFVKK